MWVVINDWTAFLYLYCMQDQLILLMSIDSDSNRMAKVNSIRKLPRNQVLPSSADFECSQRTQEPKERKKF